ncbi:MAG: lysostaphin resistance A-like protein [Hyphomicrobiaceae bacterium]
MNADAAPSTPGAGPLGLRTPWSAPAAAVATALIVLVSMLAATAMAVLYFALTRTAGDDFGASRITLVNTMIGMLIAETIMVVLALWLAGWFKGSRWHVLSLDRPLTARMFVIGLGGMALILLPYNAAIFLLWPDHFTADLRPFADLAKSDAAWVAAIVVAVGAPLSEELLFRGFLLPALTKSKLQFWGAALLSTLAWTVMHWGYSAVGMIEVYIIGLYFCWLMWRFGSLWLTIALHAFYNALQFAVLTQVTLPPLPQPV